MTPPEEHHDLLAATIQDSRTQLDGPQFARSPEQLQAQFQILVGQVGLPGATDALEQARVDAIASAESDIAAQRATDLPAMPQPGAAAGAGAAATASTTTGMGSKLAAVALAGAAAIGLTLVATQSEPVPTETGDTQRADPQEDLELDPIVPASPNLPAPALVVQPAAEPDPEPASKPDVHPQSPLVASLTSPGHRLGLERCASQNSIGEPGPLGDVASSSARVNCLSASSASAPRMP